MTRKRVAAVILLQLLLGALVAINTSEAKPSEVVMEAEAPAAGTPTGKIIRLALAPHRFVVP
jgi:hypothetical protein